MNLKKLFASFSVVALLAATFVPAVQSVSASSALEAYGAAYEFAKDNGMTTMPTFEKFNALGSVERGHLAKFAVNFYENVMGQNEVVNSDCNFSDMASIDPTLPVKEACEYGLMKGWDGAFHAKDLVTRGQAMTVISRMLDGSKYDGGSPFWSKHETNLYDLGIITVTGLGAKVALRGNVVKMFMNTETYLQSEGLLDGGNECEGLDAVEDKELWDLLECTATDTDEEEDTDEDTTEEDVPVITCDSTVEVEVTLNENTPKQTDGEVLAGDSTGVPVAVFDLTAGSSNAVVKSITLERVGLGGDETLEGVALRLYDTKQRITDVKSDNGDDVKLTIKGGLELAAGQTVAVEVIVNVNPTYYDAAQTEDQSAGDTFKFIVTEVDGECMAATVTELPSYLMTVGTKDAPQLEINEDTAPEDVKVGQNQVEIATYTIKNNDVDDKDVELESITFENEGTADLDEAATNFKMYIDDELVASDSLSSDDYITFFLDSTYTLEDGKEYDVQILADIEGGVDDTIYLVTDELDITAYYESYNYREYAGAELDDGTAGSLSDPEADAKNWVVIQAGELLIEKVEDNVEIRADKDEELLGSFKVIVNNDSSNLYLENVRIEIENMVPNQVNPDGSAGAVRTTDIEEFLTNVELYNATNGESIDLIVDSSATSNATEVVFKTSSDEESYLEPGANLFYVRADIPSLNDAELADFVGSKYKLSFSEIGDNATTAGLVVREDEDDKLVTDVTPSSFDLIAEAVGSSIDVHVIDIDSTYNTVIGARDVKAVEFELKAGNDTDVTIEEVTFCGYKGGATAVVNDDPSSQNVVYFSVLPMGWTGADAIAQPTLYNINSATASTISWFYQVNGTEYEVNSSNYSNLSTVGGVINSIYSSMVANLDTDVYTITTGAVTLADGTNSIGITLRAQSSIFQNWKAYVSDVSGGDFRAQKGATVAQNTIDVYPTFGTTADKGLATSDSLNALFTFTVTSGATTNNYNYIYSAATTRTGSDGTVYTGFETMTELQTLLSGDLDAGYTVTVPSVTVGEAQYIRIVADSTSADLTVTVDNRMVTNRVRADDLDDIIESASIMYDGVEIAYAGKSDISNNEIVFEDLQDEESMNIPMSTDNDFEMVVDILDEVANVGEVINFAVCSVQAEDAEGDDLSDPVSAVDPTVQAPLWVNLVSETTYSTRNIIINEHGTLDIALDTDNFETLREQNLLGGAGLSSEFVASFDLRAEYETIELEKLKVRFFAYDDSGVLGTTYSGATSADMSEGVSYIVFYDEDQVTEIARESIPDGQSYVNVDFNSYAVEGTKTIFAKYITQRMGMNNEGSPVMNHMITAEVIEANSRDTAKPINGMYLTTTTEKTDASTADDTDPSKPVTIFPVRVSAANFYDEVTINSQTTKVANTLVAAQDQVIAILGVTADGAFTNNWQSTSNDAMLMLSGLTFTIDGDILYNDLTSVTIQRIGGSNNNSASATCSAGVCTVDMYGAAGSFVNKTDTKVTPGSTAYYAIKIDNTELGGAGSNFSAKIDFDLTNGGITYTTDEPTQLNFVDDLRLSTDTLESDVLYSTIYN